MRNFGVITLVIQLDHSEILNIYTLNCLIMPSIVKQIKLHRVVIPEDVVIEEEKVFTPDFGNLSLLYKEFGINNDIDLAIQKPQYRDIVNSRLADIPVQPSPNLDDGVMLDNMVSRELDANELREYAISQGKQYKKD